MTMVERGSPEDIANSIKQTIGDTPLPVEVVKDIIDHNVEAIPDTETMTKVEFFKVISEVKQELEKKIAKLEGVSRDNEEQPEPNTDKSATFIPGGF